ncbi:MAG: hypothetical protein ACREPX_00370, partial [Rhodanobacteraceae bacterium]
MKMMTLAVAVVVMSGCAEAAVKSGQRVTDADAAKVANCTFLKEVGGSTMARGGTKSAIGQGMNEAREEAAKAGATDIIWDSITSPN